MLPFLKRKQEAGSSEPIEVIKRESDGDTEYEVLDAVAEDLCSAMGISDESKKSLVKSALEALCSHIQDMDKLQDKEESK